jgi:hypothetical protein
MNFPPNDAPASPPVAGGWNLARAFWLYSDAEIHRLEQSGSRRPGVVPCRARVDLIPA